ncbi:serine/threonine-protein kinase [Leptolyngbya sp. PCC 6406]|uniref:serine/threonine-protein kinase n=1 Tax=Leptolyngbya sp. PCC 6406 TaxID=1173264 RepID=UPI0002AD1649|nr:serine/threonine-protein kinase [Leptolyngbya sp. PCC 6406]
MDIVCTRPSCPRPENHFADLDSGDTVKTVRQKFCTACGMPLILSGRYLTERLLGKGGFGAAYLARDRYTPTMRRCVVKLFQPSGNLSPAQMQLAQSLFEREAAVLEDLGNRHRQIPNLYAFFPLIVPGQQPGSQDEFFYLVQEFIDGEDLEQELARRGAFSQGEMTEVLVEMLKVLAFVHENGTIHRDIKPSNIMRHRNGSLYLLDFGAVKQVTNVQGAAQGQSTGIYSMGFAPPEQMAGGTVYPSTDLYALAVTCITLLTGKATGDLYDSYNNVWSWRSHAQVNDAIAEVLDRMLLSTPNQRYPGAKDVLEALRAAAQQVKANPSSNPQTPTPLTSGSAGTAIQSPVPAPAMASPVPAASASPRAAAPSIPAPSTPRPAAPRASTPSISLVRLLGGAAFTGFEGSLLAIALFSLLGTTWLGSGAWLLLVVGLVLLQLRSVIERFDLVIIGGVTLGVVLVFPSLRSVLLATGAPLESVLVLAVLGGLMVVAIATLFRLIYRLLSTIL